MGWNRQRPVPHMKWKKVKAKTRSINLQRKKKKGNRLEDHRNQLAKFKIQDGHTEQTFELLLSNQRHEEKGKEERTAIKKEHLRDCVLPSDLNKTEHKKTSLGN